MPQNITDADTWSTPATCEADGDSVNGANRLTHEQKIANRTEFLRKRLLGGEVGDVFFVPLEVPNGAGAAYFEPAEVLAAALGISQTSVTAPLPLVVPLKNLPKKGTIKSLNMTIDPANDAAHASAPTGMPRIRLYRQDAGAATAPTLIGDVTDTFSSQAAYEAVHTISDLTINEVLADDSGLRYYLAIEGEASPNAAVGLKILNIWLEIDP